MRQRPARARIPHLRRLQLLGNPRQLRLTSRPRLMSFASLPVISLRSLFSARIQFSGEYQVDTDGSVSLPLAGTIVVAGLSKSELEHVLTNKLKTSLRDPKVTVGVASFRPFYVLGEVQKPGEYPYRSGLNVLSAIAMAGGATYRANNSVVLIQRSGKDDFTEYAQSPSVAVLPGDVVRLRERFF